MGQTLQAPLHAEASAQTAVISDREPDLGLYRPEAVAVGGFAPLAEGLSRASRTRCATYPSGKNVQNVNGSRCPPGLWACTAPELHPLGRFAAAFGSLHCQR